LTPFLNGAVGVLILVQIDISQADLGLFDDYEAQVLALLPKYGATLHERLRTTDGRGEVHLLDFPDRDALEAFRADPVRAGLQDAWRRSGAASVVTEVVRLG
jgi:uncharacterized protein (DUF1330 family)